MPSSPPGWFCSRCRPVSSPTPLGRRVSYLLGTVTLSVSTLLYVGLWQIEAPFWAWALVSILIGLGFTFFSGAVEAWLVDALTATAFTGTVESVFARGQIVSGSAMLGGSVAGGFIAAQTSLAVPFVLRGAILVVMFVVAFRLMHDLGFTPEKGGSIPREVRNVASASIDYGWRVPAVKWLMLESLVGRRRGHLRLLRAAAIPAGAVRRPAGVPDRRPRGGHRRRRADPRWSGGTSHPAALSPPHVRADRSLQC